MVQVFGRELFGESGERVSIAWVICPEVGDSQPKGWIIPNVVVFRMEDYLKVGIFGPAALG